MTKAATFPVWKPKVEPLVDSLRRTVEHRNKLIKKYTDALTSPMKYPESVFPIFFSNEIIGNRHIKYVNIVFRQLLRQLIYIGTKHPKVVVFHEDGFVDQAMKHVGRKCCLSVFSFESFCY